MKNDKKEIVITGSNAEEILEMCKKYNVNVEALISFYVDNCSENALRYLSDSYT